MAVDKLVDSTQLDTDLTAVADAIRTKGGTSASLAFPANFVSAIENIPSGGGGGISVDDWFAGTAPASVVIGDVVPNRENAFSGAPFETLRWNCTKDSNYSFSGMSEVFSRMVNLKTFVAPFCEAKINAYYWFRYCNKLKTVDIRMSRIMNTTFANCPMLDTLILRYPNVVPLPDLNVLNNGTPFASNGSGGTLYVPQALISAYQSATNWSTILGYANNQILPIEGSIYETQYADGTPII